MLLRALLLSLVIFFFIVTATTKIYTLSLHDALPISPALSRVLPARAGAGDLARSLASVAGPVRARPQPGLDGDRSEEHTSELQSRRDLVCRLLLEKKKKKIKKHE